MSFIQASKQKEPEDVDNLAKRFEWTKLDPVPDGKSESDTPPEADNVPGPASRPDSALPDCVPFDWTRCKNEDEIKEILKNPSRYLFRVSDSRTQGETCKDWVKSKDVVDYEEKKKREGELGISGEDKVTPYENDFLKLDREEAALRLNAHCQWFRMPDGKSNFHSWTSSLLFAITYAIYRTKYTPKNSSPMPLEKIFLCVVDTSRLKGGVFTQDMELMDEYCDQELKTYKFEKILKDGTVPDGPSNWDGFDGLRKLTNLRRKTGEHRGLDSYYYFGEYLSQGALRITNASMVISFDKIINESLYKLHPHLKAFVDEDYEILSAPFQELLKGKAWMKEKGESPWAYSTMILRDGFYRSNPKELTTTDDEIEAVDALVKDLDPKWQLPMAASLLALRCRQKDEKLLLNAIHRFLDANRGDISSLEFLGPLDDKLPEVTHFHEIAEAVIQDQKDRSLDASHATTSEMTPTTSPEITPTPKSTPTHSLRPTPTTPFKLTPTRRLPKNVIFPPSQEHDMLKWVSKS